MPQKELNGYKFEYVEKGTGEPVVLVHGSASDYRTWKKPLEELSKHYRTIAYSRRYHWPNEKISEGQDYSMLQHVDDLEALLQSLDQPAHLIGHSYGGFVCLLLAIRNPQLVRTLVLAEPPVVTLHISNKPKPGELLKVLFSRPRTALAIIKFGAKGISPATAAAKQDNMEKALDIFGKATLGVDTFNNLSSERLQQSRDNLIKAEFLGSGLAPLDRQKVRNIKMPVLLLKGEKSPKLFRYLLDELNELIPHAEREEIPGASHIMHDDNLDYYNSVVLSFLEQHKAV